MINPKAFAGPEYDGMSLLDYFAGQALSGFCVNPKWHGADLESVTVQAYSLAEMMLIERLEVRRERSLRGED